MLPTRGSIFPGSSPSRAIASRMLARSTIAGTPVKSFREREEMNNYFTPHETKDEVGSFPHLQKHTGRLEGYLH